MSAMLDASPDDSSHVEQPPTMPAGVSALGSLDKRRMTDELRGETFHLTEPVDQKVREVERLNMLRPSRSDRRPDRVTAMDPS
jgi:hypothetical protein